MQELAESIHACAATLGDVCRVANGMRDEDRHEVLASSPVIDGDWAERFYGNSHHQWSWHHDGECCAVAVATQTGRYSWNVALVGTPDIRHQIINITADVRLIIEWLKADQGARRIWAFTTADSVKSIGWLAGFGLEVEARHPYAGLNGETMVVLAWIGEDDV